MRKRFLIGAVAMLAMAFGAADARAATITLDFSTALYSGANGQFAYATTDQGIGVNLAASPAFSTLTTGAQGVGINLPILPDDGGEVGTLETLTVTFGDSQFVETIALEQLFSNERTGAERGQYSINGGAFVPFVALSNTGLLTLNIGAAGVNNIRFQSSSAGSLGGIFNDYSVRSINVTAVPEPASMILVGSGLVGAFMRRRKKTTTL
jgi:hypothetical protein